MIKAIIIERFGNCHISIADKEAIVNRRESFIRPTLWFKYVCQKFQTFKKGKWTVLKVFVGFGGVMGDLSEQEVSYCECNFILT